MQHAPNDPQLACIFLWNCGKHVVKFLKGFLVLFLHDKADDDVETKLVDVKTAKADVGKICLTACMTHVILCVVFIINLVLGVKDFVHMHDATSLLEI